MKQTPLPRTRSFQVGKRVQSQFFNNNKRIWEFGTISQKLGKLHYIVKLDKGRLIKRHINQLLKTSREKKRVTFEEEF